MNPLAIGGVALVALLFAVGARSSTASSQGQMIFKDYAWVTTLPTFTGPGGDIANPLAKQLPPPPNVQGAGSWHPVPGGQAVAGQSSGGTYPPFTAWQGVTPGTTLWMWVPKTGGTNVGQVAPVVKINGYWVAETAWHVATSPQEAAAFGLPPQFTPAAGYPPVDVSPQHPAYHFTNAPPPPPGESASSGKWLMKHPGYVVWLTTANANEQDALALMAEFSLGQPTAATPVAPPTGAPIAVTPPGSPVFYPAA